MEIQRKIVESKNPPSNREVWWFDTNTEVLKRYTGSTWVQVVDSADSTKPEIETTYEEAKALYESGDMKEGVYYKFKYTQVYGYNYLRSINNFDIKVYLEDKQLYAKGSYKCEGRTLNFTSKYNFNNNNKTVSIDGQIVTLVGYTTYTVNYNDGYSHIAENLKSLLDEKGIAYNYQDVYNEEYGTYNMIFKFPRHYCVESYVNGNSTSIFIPKYTDVGFTIIHGYTYDEYEGTEYESYEVETYDKQTLYNKFDISDVNNTGYLYDLDYGYKKHSYLVDIMDQINDNYENVSLAVECNVDNNIDDLILLNIDNVWGNYTITGELSNTSINLSVPTLKVYEIYARNAEIHIDNENYIDDKIYTEGIIVGALYYNKTLSISKFVSISDIMNDYIDRHPTDEGDGGDDY